MENETIKHLNNFNEMLYQRLQDVEHRLERLKIICSSLGANDFSEITSQLSNLKTDIASLKQTVKENNSTITALKSSVDTNTATLSNLSNDVTTNSNTIHVLEDVTNAHTNKLAIHDQQFQNIDINTITQNQEKLNSLEAQVDINKTDISNLKSNTADLATIRSRLLNAESDLINLNTSFENYKDDQEVEQTINLGRIDVKINNLTESTQSHETKITALEETTSTNTTNINTNTSNIEEIKTQLENSKIENELSFILNGTYLLQADIDKILDGTYRL